MAETPSATKTPLGGHFDRTLTQNEGFLRLICPSKIMAVANRRTKWHTVAGVFGG